MAAGKDLGALVGQIGADITQWKSAHRQIQKDLAAMESRGRRSAARVSAAFQQMGSKLKSAGSTLNRSVTLPIVGAAAAAVKLGADFESSLTRIETLVGIARENVQGMRKDVLNIASATGRGPQELSEALFTVTSAGLRGEQAMGVLEKSAKAAAIGLGETRNIAQALTGILQSYSKQNLTAAEATDTLIGIVREGNLEAAELAPTLGRVTGIASQLGISFKEVGASIASFTRLGVDSAEAVTGLRGIMNAFLQQTPKSVKALQSVGLSFEDITKSIRDDGLARALVGLIDKFKGNNEGLSALFGNVRGLSAVLGTAGAQTQSYLQIVDNLTQSQGNLDKGFARVSKTVQFQFNQALSNLRISAIKAGTKLFPLVEKMVNKLGELAQSFADMSEKSRMRLLKLAGVLAVGGPVLTVLGQASLAISGLIKLFETLSTTAIPSVISILETGYIKAMYAAETATAAFLAKFAVVGGALTILGLGVKKAIDESKELASGLNSVSKINIENASVKELEQRVKNIKNTLATIASRGNRGNGFGNAGQLENIKMLREELEKTKAVLEDMRPEIFKTPGMILDDTGVGLGSILNQTKNQKPFSLLLPVSVEPKVVNKDGGTGGDGQGGMSAAVKSIYSELQSSLSSISAQAEFPNLFPDFDAQEERINTLREALKALLTEGVSRTSEGFKNLSNQLRTAMESSVESVQRVTEVASVSLSNFDTQGDDVLSNMNEQLDQLRRQDELIPNFDLAAAKVRLYTQTLTTLANQGYGDNILQVQMLQEALRQLQSEQDKTNNKLEEGNRFGQQFGQTFTSSLEEAIFQFETLGDVVSGFFKDLARLIYRTQISTPLFNNLFGKNGSGGLLSGFLSNFGGGRASGGSVMASKTYMVGERGPELFSPATNGTIVPNKGLGGGEVTINVINNNNSEVGVEKRKTAGGGLDIGIVIDQRVKDGLNKGRYDREFASNLGVRRKGY